MANLEVCKNTNFEKIQSLFNITQILILEHSEDILNVHTAESTSLSWTRSTLSHDLVIQWRKKQKYGDTMGKLAEEWFGTSWCQSEDQIVVKTKTGA